MVFQRNASSVRVYLQHESLQGICTVIQGSTLKSSQVACSGNPADTFCSGSKYRSPNEFEPHLDWLRRGDRSIPCACALCAHQRGDSPLRKRKRGVSEGGSALSADIKVTGVTRKEGSSTVGTGGTNGELMIHCRKPVNVDWRPTCSG